MVTPPPLVISYNNIEIDTRKLHRIHEIYKSVGHHGNNFIEHFTRLTTIKTGVAYILSYIIYIHIVSREKLPRRGTRTHQIITNTVPYTPAF